MTPKHLSPLDRMKRDNSPTAIDRWNECVARWEEAQREKLEVEPYTELRRNGTTGEWM